MKEEAASYRILTLNTVAFTVCFAAWMLNGVLVTFLVENGLFEWDAAQMGTLIGIPVLTGSLMRLPVGMLTDKFGGRPVYTLLMLFSAIPMFYLSPASRSPRCGSIGNTRERRWGYLGRVTPERG